ncbi:exopolysaccharide regulatory tyrosine autokinase VpsO [Sphingomonas cynarae]|uniref:non-specific protein-tyrosine kinase n=1 Tax=Sphingomonas cynarae TaxID=930197 RepID=A0ABP7EV97_9SPHN
MYANESFLTQMNVEPAVTPIIGLSAEETRREQVLRTLQRGLKVDYTGNTRIAQLSFTSPNPKLAAQVANAYADSFIRNNLARKLNTSTYALDFLRGQLTEAQQRLQQSERDALGYARRTRIVDVANAAGSSSQPGQSQSLLSAQLVQLNQAYTTALADRIQAEEKWERIRLLPTLQIPEVLANNSVADLLQRRAQILTSLEEQTATRRDDHPAVLQARSQVREINAQIGLLGNNIRNSIRAPYTIALAREKEIANSVETLKNTTLVEQNQGIELSILQREAGTNRQQYDSLLKRYNELNAEAGVQTNNLSVVDRAEVPRQTSWPRPMLTLLAALIAATILSVIVIIAREQLFDAIRSPDDIEDRLKMPLLGTVPISENATSDAVAPKSALSEAFSSIRTNLSVASQDGMPHSIMLTSTQASEGKSNACFGLAHSVTRQGKRVLVVDVDYRRPNVHKLFGVANDIGLSNVITGQVEIEVAVKHTDNDLLDVLTAGTPPPNPTELISSPHMQTVIADLEKAYDLVIYDSAPVLGLADAVVLSARTPATLFVIEAGRSSVRAITGAIARIRRGGGHVTGAVLTKFDPGKFGYGSHDAYYYDYGNDERD